MKQIKKYWGVALMATLSILFGVITVMMTISFYETIVEEVKSPMFRFKWADAGVYIVMIILWLAGVVDTAAAAIGSTKIYKKIKKWEA